MNIRSDGTQERSNQKLIIIESHSALVHTQPEMRHSTHTHTHTHKRLILSIYVCIQYIYIYMSIGVVCVCNGWLRSSAYRKYIPIEVKPETAAAYIPLYLLCIFLSISPLPIPWRGGLLVFVPPVSCCCCWLSSRHQPHFILGKPAEKTGNERRQNKSRKSQQQQENHRHPLFDNRQKWRQGE